MDISFVLPTNLSLNCWKMKQISITRKTQRLFNIKPLFENPIYVAHRCSFTQHLELRLRLLSSSWSPGRDPPLTGAEGDAPIRCGMGHRISLRLPSAGRHVRQQWEVVSTTLLFRKKRRLASSGSAPTSTSDSLCRHSPGSSPQSAHV